MTGQRHPAFGKLQISRVHGRYDNLVGVDFPVGGAVRFTVSTARLSQDNSWDSFYEDDMLVEFEMSEVQFAHAITALNHAEGSPITLRRCRTGALEQMPDPPKHMRDFDDRVSEALEPMDRAVEYLKELNRLLADPKAKKSDIKHAAFKAQQEIEQNLEYTMGRGKEIMQEVGEKTKQEVRAYAEGVALQFGLEALGAARAALPNGIDATPSLEDRRDG